MTVIIFGCVKFPSVKAWTPVEGHITQDTWWTIEDSPYRLVKDVIVDPNVTLTIEPGVRVEFADGMSLIVEGSLYCLGTEDKPINFTSSNLNPYPGIYEGIKFEPVTNSSLLVLNHSLIEYADIGVLIQSKSIRPLSSLAFINNTMVRNTIVGINISRAIHPMMIIIQNSEITHNIIGIQVGNYLCAYQDINLTIYGNDISDNLLGIIIHYVVGDKISIFDNSLFKNLVGLHVFSSELLVKDNLISAGQVGIFLVWPKMCQIIRNTITSHEGEGELYGETIINIVPTLEYFRKEHNMRSTIDDQIISCGILICDDMRNAIIMNNSISYNDYGIYFFSLFSESFRYDSKANVTFNDIYENNKYGIFVTGDYPSCEVVAENNYWGDPTGPFHPSINPEGLGDQVNGDGQNLDFIPFRTLPLGHINQRPIAILDADKTHVAVNELITLNASQSYDDGQITY